MKAQDESKASGSRNFWEELMIPIFLQTFE
jgi:hypothetical protein